MIELTIRTSNEIYKLQTINKLEWHKACDLMNWIGVFTQKGVLMNVVHDTDERVYIMTDYNL